MKLENLTGEIICKKIRSRCFEKIFFWILAIILALLFIGYAIHGVVVEHSIAMPLFALLLGVGGCIWGIAEIRKSVKTLSDVPNCKLFRKYGSPESIAQTIAEGAGKSIVSCKQTLLTEQFILKTKDFESFVPLESVLLLYKREHRTNGFLDSVSLVIHDEYGDQFEYPFKLAKKYQGEFNIAGDEIAKHSPNARFGYTKENLKFVEQNEKKI